MKYDELAELVAELNPDALQADGLEDAAVGYTVNQHSPALIVYDLDKCVDVLVKRDGMTPEGAEEFLEFNTLGAYVGPNGPLYVRIVRWPAVCEDRPMTRVAWIPVVERAPAVLDSVIVSSEGRRNFAAIYLTSQHDGTPVWCELYVSEERSATIAVIDVRATDFWLPLPAWPATENVSDGDYPA